MIALDLYSRLHNKFINRNKKRSVYCQYGLYSLTFRALALRQRPMLKTFDYTIHIGSTPTFLYFDLYLYPAYEEGHFVARMARNGPFQEYDLMHSPMARV